MTRSPTDRLAVTAGVAWAVAGASGLRGAIVDDGDGWELGYNVFAISLLVAAALTVILVAGRTRRADRRSLQRVGVAVGAVGVLTSVVAWALPLWMSMLGAGFGLLALSSAAPARRPLALLAGGQAAGMVVMFAGLTAEIGRTDEWGDHPLAGGIGIAVAASTAIAAIAMLGRQPSAPDGLLA